MVRTTNILVIIGHLYNMRLEEILRCYVTEFERNSILVEAHGRAAGGNYVGKATMQKIFVLGCGGGRFIRIPRLIVRHVMHVRGWASHHEGMSCL